MAKDQEKAKRWRPRFSVRTLLITVTLASCYAACWGPTKRRGATDVVHHNLGTDIVIVDGTSSILPLEVITSPEMPLVVSCTQANRTKYYFWFFGYVGKLPYERDVPPFLDPQP